MIYSALCYTLLHLPRAYFSMLRLHTWRWSSHTSIATGGRHRWVMGFHSICITRSPPHYLIPPFAQSCTFPPCSKVQWCAASHRAPLHCTAVRWGEVRCCSGGLFLLRWVHRELYPTSSVPTSRTITHEELTLQLKCRYCSNQKVRCFSHGLLWLSLFIVEKC